MQRILQHREFVLKMKPLRCGHTQKTRDKKATINEFKFHTTIIKTEYIFP